MDFKTNEISERKLVREMDAAELVEYAAELKRALDSDYISLGLLLVQIIRKRRETLTQH